MAPVPRALRLPLYSPLACKPTLSSVAPLPRDISRSPTLSPISARSSRRSLPPSNLSTSGQPHLLVCPQDINRIQRLVSVYTHARIYTLVCTLLCTSVPINRRNRRSCNVVWTMYYVKNTKLKNGAWTRWLSPERSGDIISLLNFSLGKTSSGIICHCAQDKFFAWVIQRNA